MFVVKGGVLLHAYTVSVVVYDDDNAVSSLFHRHAGAKLDYDSACLVARYLSSKRPFAQSFDIYLTQVQQLPSISLLVVVLLLLITSC